jgi:3-oxoacyl-[acyl-carrier protein] reductase
LSKVEEKPIALVTGTSAGIGYAIATRLLAQGWLVLGIDKSPACIAHSSFESVHLDLTQSEDLTQWLAQPRGALLIPTAIIHAAGFMNAGPLESAQAQANENMWRVHVASISQLVNRLVPAMKQRNRGRVIMIGSRVAQGIANRSQYAATKAALLSLARSWAAEVIRHGITVNVISPAATQTGMLDDKQRLSVPPKLPPLGRLIQPDEIASMVSYLLSPDAAAITGQNIQICGGASLEY